MKEQKKYNIKIKSGSSNPKKADSHKDFEKVYSAYSSWVYRHPWYKAQLHMPRYRKVFMYVLLIVLISYLVYEAIQKEQEMEKAQQEQVDSIPK